MIASKSTISTLVRRMRISDISHSFTAKNAVAAFNTITQHNFSTSAAATVPSTNDSVTKTPPPCRSYAIVNHKEAYEEAMSGRHGKQLALAYQEGVGADDPEPDYFELFFPKNEKNLNEETQAAIEEGLDKDNDDGDDKDDDDDIEEQTLEEFEEDEEEESDYKQFLNYAKEIKYNKDGSLQRPKSELIAYAAGYPAGGQFAIINPSGNNQFKVCVDDVVICNKLKPTDFWEVGSYHTLTNEQVLLMGNSDKTLIGMPGIKGGEVDVLVEEITHDKTILAFKKRRRKNSRRKNGFRREVTFLRVLDIRLPDEAIEYNADDNKKADVVGEFE